MGLKLFGEEIECVERAVVLDIWVALRWQRCWERRVGDAVWVRQQGTAHTLAELRVDRHRL